MSTEPDYNFNETAAIETAGSSIALPFALISIAVAIFLASQTTATFFARNTLADGKTQIIKNKGDLEQLRSQRVKLVEQSKVIQQKLQDMATDLVLLAQTDKEADTIVKKYGISVQPRGTGDGAAPAPAPAPPQ